MIIEPIAYIRTDFPEKFGVPRQSGRADELIGRIIFEEKYRCREALRGIEEFSHLWLIFDFSLSHCDNFSPTVRPPRLGGNKRIGVFASRSPFRPNSLGLSCVTLEKVEETQEGPTLVVRGADLVDKTPIYDIKPYVPYSDCKPQARGGFAQDNRDYSLDVSFPDSLLTLIPKDKRNALISCLRDDPRPSYHDNPQRIYAMSFAGKNIKFRVEDKRLFVVSVEQSDEKKK